MKSRQRVVMPFVVCMAISLCQSVFAARNLDYENNPPCTPCTGTTNQPNAKQDAGNQLNNEPTADLKPTLERASSVTAATVVSSSRSGQGAAVQSIYFPRYEDSLNRSINWVGKVHSLMVDEYGNMRVDMYLDKTTGTVKKDVEDLPLLTGLGVRQLNIRNEDYNNNGVRDTTPYSEDVNSNGKFDANEDLNGNGRLDTNLDETNSDFDDDGALDRRDLIVVFDGGQVQLWDDSNENGRRDDEDMVFFSPDIVAWHGNGILDKEDLNDNGVLDSGEDLNGNNELDTEDLNGDGDLDTEQLPILLAPEEINYLWSSRQWLDTMIDPLGQRPYNSSLQMRHFFTFVDNDGNMVNDAETVSFESWPPMTPVSAADIRNPDNFYSHLTLYPSFEDTPMWVQDMNGLDSTYGNTDYKDELIVRQTKRVIDFIRGVDQGVESIDPGTGPMPVPAMRSRQYKDPLSGLDLTWRMGDVVNSAPTLVGRPSEGYHLIYRDESYAHFVARYLNRRNVVYVGGNDGMIHAFNGGFFNSETKTYQTAMAEPFIDINKDGVRDASEKYADLNNDGVWNGAIQTPHALGAELWAYIPQNLLPHLYWLTEESYQHVYFNDLSPKIFDAKIFPEDADHPKGWGTVMVVGMRFGGGHITADVNRNDVVDVGDKEMSSAFSIFDITNPEVEPRLLAEITLPGLGYTTSFPTVLPFRTKKKVGDTNVFDSNDWYLAFGSGPADAAGVAASKDVVGASDSSGTIGNAEILVQGRSLQHGKLYVLNLNALTNPLVGSKRVEVVDSSGSLVAVTKASDTAHIEELEANSFVSQPITADFDLNFNPEALYFGTINWNIDTNQWGGKMRRLITDDSLETTDWVSTLEVETGFVIDRADNVLIDLNASGVNAISQPISAPAAIGVGDPVHFDIDGSDSSFHSFDEFDRKRWILFGTGRFLVAADAADGSQQSYYGLKEPYLATGEGFTWREVARTDLLNSTNIKVFDDRSVENHPDAASGIDTYQEMNKQMHDGVYQGWLFDFQESRERNLGQAVLLGRLLSYTTYIPSEDPCTSTGHSNLHVRAFDLGTSWKRKVFAPPLNIFHDGRAGNPTDGVAQTGETEITNTTSLGEGMALTPNAHIGREEGSTTFIQTSTGDVVTIEQRGTNQTKSHKTEWSEKQ